MWFCPNCKQNVLTNVCSCGCRRTPNTIGLLRAVGFINLTLAFIGAFAAFARSESIAFSLMFVLEGIAGLALFYGVALIAETLVSIDCQIQLSPEIKAANEKLSAHTRLLAALANAIPSPENLAD